MVLLMCQQAHTCYAVRVIKMHQQRLLQHVGAFYTTGRDYTQTPVACLPGKRHVYTLLQTSVQLGMNEHTTVASSRSFQALAVAMVPNSKLIASLLGSH